MNQQNWHAICSYVLYLVSITHFSCAFIDLEDMSQDFVLQTKRINIPDYPYAFNPSIIRWNNKLLMSFRVIPDSKNAFNSWIGVIWLNEEFEPISKPQQLKLRDKKSIVPSRVEDGRFIAVGKHLYLVYSDNEDQVISKGGFRVYIAELSCDGDMVTVKNKERISFFEGNNTNRREKNWVPFVYEDKLFLAYSLIPHRIFYPIFGFQLAEPLVISECSSDWSWGELRGGTPALLDGNEYLAFFHSSKRMTTVHSDGKEMLHYVMGAYTFSAQFPFNITRMSKEPIIGKQFYIGADYKPYWGSVRVVFPCGFIVNDKNIWITYGRQDHEIWITMLDKKKFYKSLIAVS